MREKDKFDYQAETLLNSLIHIEQHLAYDILAQQLREEYERGMLYGKISLAQLGGRLPLEVWCVQRKPIEAADRAYRFLELQQNKKQATDTAKAYNGFVADCEYRAWKYGPVEV